MSIGEKMDPKQRETLLRVFIEKFDKEINAGALQYGDQLTALAVTVLRHKPYGPIKPKQLPVNPQSKIYNTVGLIMERTGGIGRLLDHVGVADVGPTKDVLVSEPYSCCIRDIEQLVDVCRENDLKFWIDGTSYHFPGRTLTIFIYPSERSVERGIGE